MSALVRRSTKRWVSCSCSASDRLSSMARVRSCQCSGSASQSTRLDTKVQVRIWAMRLASVSMSPSVRSAKRHLLGEPVLAGCAPRAPSGTCRAWPPARRGSAPRSCGSRGPGRRPTGGSTAAGASREAPRPRGSWLTVSSAIMSSAMRARGSRPSRGDSRRLSRSRSSEREVEIAVAPLQRLHADRRCASPAAR